MNVIIRNFLIEQGYDDMEPTRIFQDNKATIALVEHGKSTAPTTKHILRDYFYTHEHIAAGE